MLHCKDRHHFSKNACSLLLPSVNALSVEEALNSSIFVMIKDLIQQHEMNLNILKVCKSFYWGSALKCNRTFKEILSKSLKLYPAKEGRALASMMYLKDLLEKEDYRKLERGPTAKARYQIYQSSIQDSSVKTCHKKEPLIHTDVMVLKRRDFSQPVRLSSFSNLRRYRVNGKGSNSAALLRRESSGIRRKNVPRSKFDQGSQRVLQC